MDTKECPSKKEKEKKFIKNASPFCIILLPPQVRNTEKINILKNGSEHQVRIQQRRVCGRGSKSAKKGEKLWKGGKESRVKTYSVQPTKGTNKGDHVSV